MMGGVGNVWTRLRRAAVWLARDKRRLIRQLEDRDIGWNLARERTVELWNATKQVQRLEAQMAGCLAREQALRASIAHDIIAELVCCDIFERMEATVVLPPDDSTPIDYSGYEKLQQSAEYHAMCHYGGWAAAIAEHGVRPDRMGEEGEDAVRGTQAG